MLRGAMQHRFTDIFGRLWSWCISVLPHLLLFVVPPRRTSLPPYDIHRQTMTPNHLLPRHNIEVFVPPSKESLLIAKHLPWLFRNYEGKSALSRWLHAHAMSFIIAPMTQFSVFSFDLNTHLFLVLHTSISARISHFLMIPVNFFLMVFAAHAFSQLVGSAPGEPAVQLGVNGATIYACLTALWYGVLAISEGLHLWALISLGLVWSLWSAAVTALAAEAWYTQPSYAAILIFISSFGMVMGHTGEEFIPPRLNFTDGWMNLVDFATRCPFYSASAGVVIGTFSEMWASIRLMPYNLLIVMFEMGYQPERWVVLQDRALRAWKSGNPALDYIGVGGGAVLDAFTTSDNERGVKSQQSKLHVKLPTP